MGIITRLKNRFNNIYEDYASHGMIPAVPVQTLQDMGFRTEKDIQTLISIVGEEGTSVVGWLCFEQHHAEVLKRIEFAQEFGLEACHAAFPASNKHITTSDIVNSLFRAIGVGAVVTLVPLAFSVLRGSGWNAMGNIEFGLAITGLIAIKEFIYYHKDVYLTKIFSWMMLKNHPQIYRNIKELGKRYLNGYKDPAAAKQSIALARAVKRRTFYDDTERILVGQSAGDLYDHGSIHGITQGVNLTLTVQDMVPGSLTIGSSGSGKTSAKVIPDIARLMYATECSIPCFDAKGNLKYQLFSLMSVVNKQLEAVGRETYKFVDIGPDSRQMRYNIIHPDVVTAAQAESIFTSMVQKSGAEFDHWAGTAAQLFGAGCRLMDLAGKVRSFKGVYRVISEESYYKDILALAEANAQTADQKEDLLAVKNAFQTQIYGNSEETRGSIMSTISRWFQRFMLSDMNNFVDETEYSLKDILNTKTILVIDIPSSLGESGRMLKYFLLKQLYAVCLNRLAFGGSKRWIQVFIDECQEVLVSPDALSDAALSREARMGVHCFTQSLPALLATLGGKDAAYSTLANLRHKYFLMTDDPETRDFMKKMVAEVETPEHSYGVSKTKGHNINIGAAIGGLMSVEGAGSAIFGGIIPGMNSSTSTSITATLKRGQISDSFLDSIPIEECIAIVAWSGAKRKDVIKLEPIYGLDVPAAMRVLDGRPAR